ncbi:MAG TPA: hypothetical protein VKC66_05210 [Xanthobacteraceae bacterium]|nr:hypothetical protein [Xanthobacteraceae bacterium]
MFVNARRLRWLKLAAAFVAALYSAGSAGIGAPAQNSGAPGVVTHIDRVSSEGEQPFVVGWACQQGSKDSIDIRIYADRAPHDSPAGTLVLTGRADFESELAVNNACQDHEGGKHRFKLPLPVPMFAKNRGRKLYAEGVPVRETIPPVPGAYKHASTHPWVFTTRRELEELAQRINVPNSYSANRFSQLASQIARDLSAPNDWSIAYSGCIVSAYLYAFSYEPQDGHDERTHAELHLDAKTKAPAGAAVVASRLALYAALRKAGAAAPQDAPPPDQAAALAKKILLAWGERGFRDAQGHFLSESTQFCDDNGKIIPGGEGLTISRGIVYSVHAQDLLGYLDALTPAEIKELNAFHSAIYNLLIKGLNWGWAHHAWACDHYGNHSANALAGLLATARLTDNQKQFEAVLDGKDPSLRVILPWTAFFDRAIYGEADIANSCYFNTGADSATSHPFFSTSIVAPGEIDDRFRHEGAGQAFGYPMFTLERLINATEILRLAGFDPYRYRGRHRQSIETAIGYYACFARGAGFHKTVTRNNSATCPDAPQYYGQLVNGVDGMVLIGAYLFPRNDSITAAESAAKTSASSGGLPAFSLDAIRFGRWRN